MAEKPSYLGLLNAISLGESSSYCYLSAWAEKTPSSDVRRVLLTAAAREGEHGLAFAKRINELGFELRPADDPKLEEKLEEKMAIVTADCSDLEKFEALGLGDQTTALDFLDTLFNDQSIDIRTGELFGRFIAEERDTSRLVRDCYQQLKAADGGTSSSELAELNAKVDALCAAVGQLQSTISSNGKVKAKAEAH